MAEKVTLRLEQLDTNESGDILVSGPVNIAATVDTVFDLDNLDLPNGSAVYVKTVTSTSWAIATLVTNLSQNQKYLSVNEKKIYTYSTQDGWDSGVSVITGISDTYTPSPTDGINGDYYLKLDSEKLFIKTNGSWIEIEQSSIPNNFGSINERKIYTFQSGSWNEGVIVLSGFSGSAEPTYSTPGSYYLRTGTTSPGLITRIEVSQETGLKARGAYFVFKELTSSWQEVLLGTHSHENKLFLDRLGSFDLTDPVGTKKFFTLQIKDTDNFDGTFEYDINWENVPEALPQAPESEDQLYLGLDSDGKPEWKNNFVASQTFQVLNKMVTGTQPVQSLVVGGVSRFNKSEGDHALVMAGKFFVNEENVIVSDRNPQTGSITITLKSDPNTSNEIQSFDPGETITVIIIRNGASAILDTLAAEYIKASDIPHILSGGTVNSLRNYATKVDLLKYSRSNHTHSQFAKADHDHDYRYAMFYHTHGEYLTRKKALELIEQKLQANPQILQTLSTISSIINEGSSLSQVLSALSQIASVTDVSSLEEDIARINYSLNNLATFDANLSPVGSVNLTLQLDSYLNSRKFRSDQIDILMDTGDLEFDNKFKTPDGESRDLKDILVEIYDKLELEIFSIDKAYLDEDIRVLFPTGETQGDYERNDIITKGTNVKDILIRLFRKEVKPGYDEPELLCEAEVLTDGIHEVGELIDIEVKTNFIKENAGNKNSLIIEREDGVVLHQSAESEAVQNEIIEDAELTPSDLKLIVTLGYDEGLPLFSNVDEDLGRTSSEYEIEGKIESGTLTKELVFKGNRAIFHGSIEGTDLSDLDSQFVRSLNKYISISYDTFEIELSVLPNHKSILFALPSSLTLSSIIYREQGLDMKSMFSESTISVTGARELYATDYTLYTYVLPIRATNKMTLIFKK
jgi:hypothetical protein